LVLSMMWLLQKYTRTKIQKQDDYQVNNENTTTYKHKKKKKKKKMNKNRLE